MIFLNIINIGIVAHVDAGKTTVTESLLYLSGAIKKIGRVDMGDTQTDSMELERKRGITIRTSAISFDYKDKKINILDTPGHTDFISEVERSLSVLDGAILVVSAVEGIQSQTLILFNTLKSLNIPTIIFVNKVDRTGSDCKKLFNEMRKNLSKNIVSLHGVFDEGSDKVKIGKLYSNDIIEDIKESLCNADESFLETYINNENIKTEEVIYRVQHAAKNSLIYPVLYGSALKGIGMENLIDAVAAYLPSSDGSSSGNLSAYVFKIDNSELKDKKVYVRIFNGQINTRDMVSISNRHAIEKVKKIINLNNCNQTEGSSITAGDIGIICGLKDVRIGDFLGIPCSKVKNIKLAEPSIRARIYCSDSKDTSTLFDALKLISDEDPLLDLTVGDFNDDIYINLFGEIQMEILYDLIKSNYGIDAKFADVMTIYKETPGKEADALIDLNEKSNPFRAGVGIKVEPLKRGEGIRYVSDITCGYLPKSFQAAVESSVYDTLKQGLLGWEVTDIKVTFIYSRYDSVTSTPAAFRNLTPMVLMEALDKAGTNLLEPLYEFHMKFSKDVCCKVISDLIRFRATFDNPMESGEEIFLHGLIPANTSKKYKLTLASYTEGKGVLVLRFHSFREIPLNLGAVRKKSRIDPLNKDTYIMYKLNATR